MDSSFYNQTRREDLLKKFVKGTSPIFCTGIMSIYHNVKKGNKVPKLLLKEFQQSMVNVSLWSVEIIKNEHHRFATIFPTFDKYVKAIIQTYSTTHVFAPSEVLHQCYLNIARRLWKQPFLVYDVGVSKIDVQKNFLRIEEIIAECIKDTFDVFGNVDEFDETTQESDKSLAQEVDIAEHHHPNNTNVEMINDDSAFDEDDMYDNKDEYSSSISTTSEESDTSDIEDEDNEEISIESKNVEISTSVASLGSIETNMPNIISDNDEMHDKMHNEEGIHSMHQFETEQSYEESVAEDIDTLEVWEGEGLSEGVSVEHTQVSNDNCKEQTNQLIEEELTQTAEDSLSPTIIVKKLDHEEEDVILQTTQCIDQDVEPQDIKLVTFDEKSEKVKSLLNLRKKVKSSLANKRTLYPSFF